MKYDIKTLIEKNEKLEELILNMSTGNNNNLPIGNLTNGLCEDDFLSYMNEVLPLKTDEALLEFECKLVDKVFRSKMVNIKCIIFINIYFLMFLLKLYRIYIEITS